MRVLSVKVILIISEFTQLIVKSLTSGCKSVDIDWLVGRSVLQFKLNHILLWSRLIVINFNTPRKKT